VNNYKDIDIYYRSFNKTIISVKFVMFFIKIHWLKILGSTFYPFFTGQ